MFFGLLFLSLVAGALAQCSSCNQGHPGYAGAQHVGGNFNGGICRERFNLTKDRNPRHNFEAMSGLWFRQEFFNTFTSTCYAMMISADGNNAGWVTTFRMDGNRRHTNSAGYHIGSDGYYTSAYPYGSNGFSHWTVLWEDYLGAGVDRYPFMIVYICDNDQDGVFLFTRQQRSAPEALRGYYETTIRDLGYDVDLRTTGQFEFNECF